ncbi:protein translocase subunit SecF [Candidatus Parcubacteria bacterium]|nr:protein translocase subunit SecF [Candidatus Parcubacteria bacterium]
MFIVKNRIAFYILSTILIGASIFAYFNYGLNYGIDFTGGSSIEIQPVATSTNVTQVEAKKVLDENFEGAVVRPYGETGFIIKTGEVVDSINTAFAEKLNSVFPTHTIARVDTIGPTLGAELKQKSITSIILVLLAIVLFITFAFRQVSGVVASWKYGVAAIIALFHDVIIPVGFFAAMNHFVGGYEVDALFITALLVVLGFSIHDTIVVFDRLRENLRVVKNKTFEEIVGISVSETFVRSINTSVTTILALIAVYIWGPDTTHHFALALIIGIAAGTYSSIFVGSNLLVTMAGWGKRK